MTISDTLQELDRMAAQIICPADNVFRRMAATIRAAHAENETCHQALKNLSACCWGQNLTQSVAGAVELIHAYRESNKRLRDALEAIRVGIENEEEHGLWEAEQILAIIAGAFSVPANTTLDPG